MDPDPLRLLETTHPLRFGSISQGPPKPRFRIRPNCRLKRPPKLVNKTVNNVTKFVDGPTQMSRRRPSSSAVCRVVGAKLPLIAFSICPSFILAKAPRSPTEDEGRRRREKEEDRTRNRSKPGPRSGNA